jgi:iron(III) transport system substrate-binding protein
MARLHVIAFGILGACVLTLIAGTSVLQAAELGKTLAEITERAKKEPPVRLAVTWRKDLRRAVAKAYKAKYGLTFKATRVRGLASRERILNEGIAGVVSYDLVNVSGELREQYVKAKIITAVPWGDLFPKLNKSLIGPNGYFLAASFSKYGIVYNTNLVKGNDIPKTWADCLDPKWKGKVAVMTRPRAYTARWSAWGKEKSIKFHQALKANEPVWSGGNTATATQIATGEQPLGCGLGHHAVINAKRRDPTAPLAFAMPEMLPIQIGEGLAMMKGAKSPNAAVLFAGFLAAEGGSHFYLQGRSSPFVEGSVTDKMVKARGATLAWGGWAWTGKREAQASQDIVQAWGFPKKARRR